MPGTDETGPIGPLTALMVAKRSTASGTSSGIAGISGRGDYAFLDLPDWEASGYPGLTVGGDVELSPDGRSVAYWYRGETSDKPDTSDGRPIVGVAVYDTVTGEVRRQPIPSQHGLMTMWMLWGADAVWFRAYELNPPPAGSARTNTGGAFTWRPDSGELDRRHDMKRNDPQYGTGWSGGLLARIGDDLVLWSVDRQGVTKVPFEMKRGESDMSVSPSAGRLAVRQHEPVLEADQPLPGRLLVADMPGAGRDAVTPVAVPGGGIYDEVMGWRGEDHVVLGKLAGHSRFWSVDVRTGHAELLLDPPWEVWDRDNQVAADAWSGPSYHAEPPPRPVDTRLLAAAQVPIVLAAGVALVLWRRRVRA